MQFTDTLYYNLVNYIKYIFRLTLAKEIDREIEKDHSLIIHATEDCIVAPKLNENNDLEVFEDTIITIIVNVTDINDNPPKFVSEIFTGGVTTAADFGLQFMHVKVLLTRYTLILI